VLWDVIRAFRFPETSAVILMIIATVTIVDLASARLRRMFV
jgi:phosphonate transport system permease protein